METQSQWVVVDQNDAFAPQTRNIRGVEVRVIVAPHDVPRAIRGLKDPDSGHFIIELRYLDQEDFSRKQSSKDGCVHFYVGKISGRVGKIDVDTNALGVQSVKSHVKTALEGLERDEKDLSKQLSYGAVQEVLNKETEKIFTPAFA